MGFANLCLKRADLFIIFAKINFRAYGIKSD